MRWARGGGGGGGRSLSHTAPPCVLLARCRPGIGLTQVMITIIVIMIMIMTSLHRAGRCAKWLLTAHLRPAHPSPVPVPHTSSPVSPLRLQYFITVKKYATAAARRRGPWVCAAGRRPRPPDTVPPRHPPPRPLARPTHGTRSGWRVSSLSCSYHYVITKAMSMSAYPPSIISSLLRALPAGPGRIR